MAVSGGAKHILLIDPDVSMRQQVAAILLADGYRVTAFHDLPQANRQLERERHDGVIAAIEWDASANARNVRALKKRASGIPLMLLCRPERLELAIQSLRFGAEDYLQSPPDPNELKARLQRMLDRSEQDTRIAFFQDQLSKRSVTHRLEARSPAMRAMVERLMRVAPMRSTVLIYGESGVGKELVARSIHFSSPRRDGPFIAINCAAMPASLIESELFGHEKGSFTGAHARVRGKFEIAHKGTIFLDEIGEMDRNTQSKLLRVLESQEFMRVGGDQSIQVNVRVIAATNADLRSLIAESRFREDLYYRLKVVTITVPPLRERRPDIVPLVRTFVDQLSRENAVPPKQITAEAMEALEHYEWPGNVRELKNMLESILVSVPGEVIDVGDLPPPVGRRRRRGGAAGGLAPGMTLEEAERELIRRTLEYTGGNRTHSAEMLGIGVRTLQRKIRGYGIRIPSTRRRKRSP